MELHITIYELYFLVLGSVMLMSAGNMFDRMPLAIAWFRHLLFVFG